MRINPAIVWAHAGASHTAIGPIRAERQHRVGATLRAFLLFPLALFAAHAQTTATLQLDPLVTNGAVGTTAVVKLRFDRGTAKAPALGALDVTVNYDPESAQVVNVAWGDPASTDSLEPPGTGSLSGIGTTLPGVIALYKVALAPAASLDSTQPQALALATITFKLTTAATNILTISVRALADSAGATVLPTLRGGFLVIN
jgi:hypothetical protein